jgi:hypothetical protein
MVFIHFSKAERMEKSTSLMTVIVQVSNVLSPAILRIRPLNGTSIGATVDAGSAAAFTRNLAFWRVSLSTPTAPGNANSTSNRLGLAPPPVNLLLKSVIFLSGGGLLVDGLP